MIHRDNFLYLFNVFAIAILGVINPMLKYQVHYCGDFVEKKLKPHN